MSETAPAIGGAVTARPGYVSAVAAQLVGRFGNMAANIGGLALVARTLEQSQFGIYVLVTGLVMALAQVADFGTGPIFAQHVGVVCSRADRHLPGRDWASFLLLRLVLGVAATVLGVIAAFALDAAAVGPMLLASLAVGFVAARFLDPLYQLAQLPFLSTVTQLWGAASVLVTVGVVALVHPTLTWFLMAFVVANLAYVGAAFMAARGLIKPPFTIDTAMMRRSFMVAVPVGIAGLMTAINGRANLLFLDYFLGPDAVASYGAATRVLDLAVNLAVVVLAPLIPVFSQSAQIGTTALATEVRRTMRLLLGLTLPLLVASPYLTPWVVRTLYGDRYASVAEILDILAFVGAGVVFALLATYALLALRITGYAIRITSTAMVANLILNILLVPLYGPAGAAIAAVGTEFILVGLVATALLRHVPSAIDVRASVLMLAGAGAVAALLWMVVPYTGPAIAILALLPSGVMLLALLRERRRGPAKNPVFDRRWPLP